MRFINFLLNNYEVVRKTENQSVSSVCTHSDKIKDSSLFVAIKGRKFDGHNYLKQAVDNGAGTLLVEKTDGIPSYFEGMILRYREGLLKLSQLLNEFYKFPSEKLFTVGVTGTNGKTSFCYLLEHLFTYCGWPTAVMGTVDHHFNKRKWFSALTTPDRADIFERLNDFLHLEARSVVMEVSSIALDQHRVEGIDFKALVFTNLTQDHLDYHGDMENYFQSKRQLFSQADSARNKNLFYLVNQDDRYGQRLKKLTQKPCWSYGQDQNADFCFKVKNRLSLKSAFELKSPFGLHKFSLPLIGDYNVYNAVAALSCAMLTGFKAEDCSRALKNFPGVPGRLQRILPDNLPFEILIDYAHTPTALACVLSTLKNQAKRIILVFGCGGDRDRKKRPQMVSTALKFADQILFTMDNPRHEDPEQIAKSALKNLTGKERGRIRVEWDRKEAIKKAIQSADSGDCVLIAGKGHESFQIIGDKRIPFCDSKIALECLKELGFNVV